MTSTPTSPPSPTPQSSGFGATSPSGIPLTGAARLDAMSASLARNWWLIALRGVIAIAFGVVAFVAPGAFVLSLVLLFAGYMLADGVFAIVGAVRAAQRHERWGFLLVEGIVDIVVAVAAVLVPGAAIWAFVLLVAAWALVTGGLMIAAAFRLHLHFGRWWLGLGGIVSILFGIALILEPGMSALVLTWWIGAYTFAFGVLLLILAIKLRSRHGAAGSVIGR